MKGYLHVVENDLLAVEDEDQLAGEKPMWMFIAVADIVVGLERRLEAECLLDEYDRLAGR